MHLDIGTSGRMRYLPTLGYVMSSFLGILHNLNLLTLDLSIGVMLFLVCLYH